VLQGPGLPVPNNPQRNETGDDKNYSESVKDFEDSIYSAEGETDEEKPYYPNQKDLNDLIRDLGLIK